MNTQKAPPAKQVSIDIPNEDKLIYTRIIHRKSGKVLFGKDPSEELNWRSSSQEVVEVVRDKVDKFTDPTNTTAADMQIHIYNYNKNGVLKKNGHDSYRASEFSKYVEKHVKKANLKS